MKQKLFYIAAFIAVVAAFCGCSSIQRVINTGDAELILERGIMYYDAQKWQKAIALLEHCSPFYKGTLKEDTLSFYKARAYFKDRDYATASERFDEFRRSFGRSAFIEDAEAMYAISLYNIVAKLGELVLHVFGRLVFLVAGFGVRPDVSFRLKNKASVLVNSVCDLLHFCPPQTLIFHI